MMPWNQVLVHIKLIRISTSVTPDLHNIPAPTFACSVSQSLKGLGAGVCLHKEEQAIRKGEVLLRVACLFDLRGEGCVDCCSACKSQLSRMSASQSSCDSTMPDEGV